MSMKKRKREVFSFEWRRDREREREGRRRRSLFLAFNFVTERWVGNVLLCFFLLSFIFILYIF